MKDKRGATVVKSSGVTCAGAVVRCPCGSEDY